MGKGCRWLWIPIILMLILQFVNMVKGTIIIPIFAALLMRLYTGKTKMNLKLILIVIGLGPVPPASSPWCIPWISSSPGRRRHDAPALWS